MAQFDEILRHKFPGADWDADVWRAGEVDEVDGVRVVHKADGGRIKRWNPANAWPEPTADAVMAMSAEADVLLRREAMVIAPIQFRRQLSAIGKRVLVEQIVAGAGEEVQDYYEYASKIERNHRMIAQFAPLVGLDTPEDIDAFFEAAAQIED